MTVVRRPLLVGALVAAVVALVASGAVAVGALRGGVGPGGHGFLAGTRPIAGDAKVDETDSLGEASKNNGEGAGEGIVPGASGWMTITLAPGHYELVCNLAGHYRSGMFAELTVT